MRIKRPDPRLAARVTGSHTAFSTQADSPAAGRAPCESRLARPTLWFSTSNSVAASRRSRRPRSGCPGGGSIQPARSPPRYRARALSLLVASPRRGPRLVDDQPTTAPTAPKRALEDSAEHRQGHAHDKEHDEGEDPANGYDDPTPTGWTRRHLWRRAWRWRSSVLRCSSFVVSFSTHHVIRYPAPRRERVSLVLGMQRRGQPGAGGVRENSSNTLAFRIGPSFMAGPGQSSCWGKSLAEGPISLGSSGAKHRSRIPIPLLSRSHLRP